jgi:tripartite-type tricarboxylate transporter receptor subunit TctC
MGCKPFFAVLFGIAFGLGASPAAAQSYPAKPIKLIVNVTPGGITDILARTFAVSLGQRVGQSVVVENRAGGSGVIAEDFVAKSPPDGYTLLVAGGTFILRPFTIRTLPYDPLTDLVPVFNIAEVAHVLVVPGSLPVKDLREFVAYAKANPGKINFGSTGVGGPPHLAIELLAQVAGLQLVHVPYKGITASLPDLMAGRLQLVSMSVGSAGGNLKSGALKALATGADRRLSSLPDVPTSAEAGVPGWKYSAYFGMFAPKGTSADIMRLLNERMQAILEEPKTKQRLIDDGAEPVGGTQASFAERLRGDYKVLGQIIRDLGIKPE